MLAPALQTVLQTLGLHMHDAGLGQRHALVLACVQLNVPHCRSQRAIPAARGVSKRARARRNAARPREPRLRNAEQHAGEKTFIANDRRWSFAVGGQLINTSTSRCGG